MKDLLGFREKCISFSEEYGFILFPICKFAVAFAAFRMINAALGYMTQMNNLFLVLLMSLISAVTPVSIMVLLAGLLVVVQCYAVHLLVAVFMLVVFFLLYIFFLRFAPNMGLALILMPIACRLGVPSVLPVACGLLGGPAGVIGVCGGGVIYSAMSVVIQNAPSLQNSSSAGSLSAMVQEALPLLTLLLDGLLKNAELMLMLIALATTLLIVYFVRRMSMDYAWHIAIVGGTLSYAVLILAGGFFMDMDVSFLQLFLSSAVAVAVGEGIRFFCFQVDYSSTQHLQFEDDEYYYYVKAVPKTAWLEERRQRAKKTAAQKKRAQGRPAAVKSPVGRTAPAQPAVSAAPDFHRQQRHPSSADPLEMPAVDFRDQLEETLRNIQDL
ncbi:MAG TPA: hypothetical protein DF613_11730 [Lachnospiraceae bacterium]|nr:hypothetical protein [Lachnospiraceae bacterium]